MDVRFEWDARKATAHVRKHGVSFADDELRPEYDFDYAKSRPNPYAKRFSPAAVAVVLEPDVAAVFGSARQVNALLCSVIRAMPGATASQPRRRKAG